MEIFQVPEDIHLFCVKAKSFPDGVMDAFRQLHALAPFGSNRKFISLSRPEKAGGIVYRAGATELKQGDLQSHGLEELVVKKGVYQMISIKDFMKDMPAIGKAFNQLTALPGIDPEGYCLEWYFNKEDVRCMVRLKDK